MRLLNALFSKFDELTDEHGVYKVETIGDVYLVSSGCPLEYRCKESARLLCFLALDMQRYRVPGHPEIRLRIGINTGPIIAGVIGMQCPRYRLMGDTINTGLFRLLAAECGVAHLGAREHTASRMSTTCGEGDIQLSDSTYAQAKSHFEVKYRGKTPVKGKGMMDTYLLLRPKNGVTRERFATAVSRETDCARG